MCRANLHSCGAAHLGPLLAPQISRSGATRWVALGDVPAFAPSDPLLR